MAQLWVNLPAKHKMSAPRYQAIPKAEIPEVALAQDSGSVRVIAGEYAGQRGSAATFSSLNVWDVKLRAGHEALLAVPKGHKTAVALLRGAITINGTQAGEADLVVLDAAGDEVRIEARADAVFLLLSGEPILEPIVGHGPFVMNTREEIAKALDDYQSGRFGRLPGSSGPAPEASVSSTTGAEARPQPRHDA
jgi:redox-sensitive bicupin YhaK (pirin superfamily)